MTPQLLLTPTARLARHTGREFALRQADAGQLAWTPPEIQSFAGWLGRLRDAWLLTSDDDRVPLSASQSLLLWQSLIDQQVFVGEPKVAELAQRAWRLIHEHRLTPLEQWDDAALSEDHQQFRAWARDYRRRCTRERLLDEWSFATELPELIRTRRVAVPQHIELVGFDLPMTPLQAAIIDACGAAGSSVSRSTAMHSQSTPEYLLACMEPRDELAAAAQWARDSLDAGTARSIAIVVPDLAGRVADVERALRRVFDPPAFALQERSDEPWHISLGEPLAHWPLVADALTVLALGPDVIDWPRLARLLRSPFLGGWDAEHGARARALASLTRRVPFLRAQQELRSALEEHDAPLLARALAAWTTTRRSAPDRAWPSVWAERFQTELSALGFATGRALDSREYQVLQRWHDLLEAFGSLDLVSNAEVSRASALALLRARADAAVFREQNPGAPVEVLGVEEALGSRFDALWITTLDAETWPGPTRRDPLIPPRLQASVPRATAEGCRERAARELAGLFAAAPRVLASFARGSNDAPIEATALFADVPLVEARAEPLPEAAPLESLVDDEAPPLHGPSRGGTAVLAQQASCPFRAFAEQRLRAVDLEAPRPGLDDATRGQLLHSALEAFWRTRRDQSELLALDDAALDDAITDAAQDALRRLVLRFPRALTRAGQRLEQRRAARMLRRWLAIEQTRPPFHVLEREQNVDIAIGELQITGKIDRLDRIEGDRYLLIDYKSGSVATSGWAPKQRMTNPQLPAYAIALPQQPTAITFARLHPAQVGFSGIADGALGIRGIDDVAKKQYAFKSTPDWPSLVGGWQQELGELARQIVAGHAAVDPRDAQACGQCHLHALCRIHDRRAHLSLEDGAEADDDD